jgi:hypothetical protein
MHLRVHLFELVLQRVVVKCSIPEAEHAMDFLIIHRTFAKRDKASCSDLAAGWYSFMGPFKKVTDIMQSKEAY